MQRSTCSPETSSIFLHRSECTSGESERCCLRPSGLPVDAVLPALFAALDRGHSVVLQAPPGAGKSTVVPLALSEREWARSKRLIMLEPRRLAARAVAQRMAATVREPVGRTIGYRMRLDTRVSDQTRIEVVTEGVLTRMLQADASMDGVAAIIFDEYHERSLQADLGLALTLDVRQNLRPELKVIVMSATLDGEAVASLLDDAPTVTALGRVFPVTTRYLGKGAPLLPAASPLHRLQQPYGRGRQGESPEAAVAAGVRQALTEEEGDALVFLPGAREIRRVQSLLESSRLPPGTRVLPLYGELSGEQQDEALMPSPVGSRKVILATNIAETSLTIEGVRVVVDSGLVRRSVFDPTTGMSRLETRRISRASAEQRQGRAGRVAPGVCYRIWSEGANRSLAPFTPPEIVEADLTALALELAAWGTQEVTELRWLDRPPAAMLASARDLLMRMGALDAQGRITESGRQMSRLGAHPRLAHMLLRAAELGSLSLACRLAALLAERDLLRPGTRDADIRTRVELLEESPQSAGVRKSEQSGAAGAQKSANVAAQTADADAASVHRARRAAHDLFHQVRAIAAVDRTAVAKSSPDVGMLLAFAYPDRIGRRRPEGGARYTLANGRGAHFAEMQSIAREDLIVAVDLDDSDRDASIRLAAPVTRSALETFMPERLQSAQTIEWSSREQAVLARRLLRLDELVLEEKVLAVPQTAETRAAMLQGLRELGIAALPWNREARELQARIELVRAHQRGGPDCWPDVSGSSLTAHLEDWLAPWLEGITRREHLARLSMVEILRGVLTWKQQRELDELAPTHMQVPSGSHIRIDYLDPSAPVVAVRLQEVFGLANTPRLVNGQVSVTFKLLSPAQRPVQVTQDLESFWRNGYAQVRKDLRGRYPKHYWPDNPLEAEPARGVRRRRS